MKAFTVSSKDAAKRADVFLSTKYQEFTRSALKNLFHNKSVFIDNKSITASRKLKTQDVLMVDEKLLIPPQKVIKMPILFEDDDVLVIDKPPGVLTHSKGALNTEPTVADFIKPYINDSDLTGNRAGIVHRLDRGTSGVIIAAKNNNALKFLQKQFSQRKVEKTYNAIVVGAISPIKAIIDAPIKRNPKRPQTFMVGQDGKPAISEYALIKTIQKNKMTYSFLKVIPKTGRTHQIRVHLSYLGYPIVGDDIYGKSKTSGLFLHAKSLKLRLPSGYSKIFTAPIPDKFKSYINE